VLKFEIILEIDGSQQYRWQPHWFFLLAEIKD